MLDPYHSWTHFPSEELSAKVALPETVSVDEFLTQVTIYWITNTMSASTRIYYEALYNHSKDLSSSLRKYSQVPTAVSYFENEPAKVSADVVLGFQ